MKPTEFLHRLDDSRIVAAIEAAERSTSGEIRVFVSGKELGSDNIMVRATLRFEKLGMTATRERNGVLLFFIPRAQKFAIIGDLGIHEKCGQAFWDQVAAELHERLHHDRFTDAIVSAVNKVGEVLTCYFPRRDDDPDELSNVIGRD